MPSVIRAAIILLLIGCSSVTVSQDYEIGADFSKYRTFDWVSAEQPRTGDIRVDNPLLDARIRSAVEQTLISKGYRKKIDGQPDMLVAYHLAIRSRIEGDSFNSGFGYGRYPYWGGAGFETTIRTYDEGMLVIDLGDAAENRLMWRGTGTRRVTEKADPQKTTRIVNQTVAEILNQFPPRPK
ncbi:MAG: hypothetical protein AMJ54_02725 [Deltaproteobacteria bacterium SG8_13]|nr:MAG: hypothetical protein AMJ54_02725 [Deltaproteobacteria bacterium SG8_13]